MSVNGNNWGRKSDIVAAVGTLVSTALVYFCTREVLSTAAFASAFFTSLRGNFNYLKSQSSHSKLAQGGVSVVEGLGGPIVAAVDQVAAKVSQAAAAVFPSPSSLAPSSAPKRKEVITSETETLHLFRGTEELKMEDADKENLRNLFIVIEKEIRGSQSSLLKIRSNLEAQDQKLAEVQAKLKVETDPTEKGNLQKEIKLIESEIKQLEDQLNITLSVDFTTGSICYTDGKGVKTEADVRRNRQIGNAVNKLIDIHNKTLEEHLVEQTKNSLQNSKEVKDKGKKVTVLEVDLSQKKYRLDVDGKEEWLEIPQDKVSSGYSELGDQKKFYIQVAGRSQSKRPIELLTERLNPVPKKSWKNYFLSQFKKSNSEPGDRALLVEIDRELRGVDDANGEVETLGLTRQIFFLEKLIKKGISAVNINLEKSKQNDLIGISELNQNQNSLEATGIREKGFNELKKVDFSYVTSNLTGSEESKNIKKKILERLALFDQKLTLKDLEKHIEGISFDEYSSEKVQEAKTELLKDVEKIDLNYVLLKLKARKSALEGKDALEFKKREKVEKARRELQVFEGICSGHKERELAGDSKLDQNKYKQDLEEMRVREQDLNLNLIENLPIFKKILEIKETSSFQKSKDPFGDLFHQLQREYNLSSPRDTQHLIDWCGTLVDSNAPTSNPLSSQNFTKFVESLKTPFHAYVIRNKQFNLVKAYDAKNLNP